MKIRYASDLHLEGFLQLGITKTFDRFLPSDKTDQNAVLVLAGDICSKMDLLQAFLAEACQRFKAVVYVPGNHEYYKSEYFMWNDCMQQWSYNFDNLFASYDQVKAATINNVRFIYGTLWADGGQSFREECDIGICLNDFHLIKYSDRRFKVSDMKEINKEQKSSLIKHLTNASFFENPVVVVTHHLPSHTICHPRFGTDINGGFASNLDQLMYMEYAPDYWIHGHTHDTIDVQIGSTRVLANPCGYKSETNNTGFNSYGKKYIELV